MLLLFCWVPSFRVDGADKLNICDVFPLVGWNFGFLDESDCVGWCYMPLDALGQSSKLIGGGDVPYFLELGMMQQLAIFDEFTGVHVDYCVNFVTALGFYSVSYAVLAWGGVVGASACLYLLDNACRSGVLHLQCNNQWFGLVYCRWFVLL